MIVNLFNNLMFLRNLVPFVQIKNMKNTHGGVLVLVKLQALAIQVFWIVKTEPSRRKRLEHLEQRK